MKGYAACNNGNFVKLQFGGWGGLSLLYREENGL